MGEVFAWLGLVLGVCIFVSEISLHIIVLLIFALLFESSVVEISLIETAPAVAVLILLVWAHVLAGLFESLLILLVAVLVLLRLQSEGHHLRVKLITWLSQLFVAVRKVALVAECAVFVSFEMPASLSFILVIDFSGVGCIPIILLVIVPHVIHLALHLSSLHHDRQLVHSLHLALWQWDSHVHAWHWHWLLLALAHILHLLLLVHHVF